MGSTCSTACISNSGTVLLSCDAAVQGVDAAAGWFAAPQVPPYVAQRWRQAIAGANASGVDEDARGDVLGQITLEQVSSTPTAACATSSVSDNIACACHLGQLSMLKKRHQAIHMT